MEVKCRVSIIDNSVCGECGGGRGSGGEKGRGKEEGKGKRGMKKRK
jgi:hypothetical protein